MRISDWSSDVCSSQKPPWSEWPAEHPEIPRLLMEGKRKARNHFPQFLPGGDMTDAQCPQLPLVEQCKAGREKFAIDNALGQAENHTEADSFRQFDQRFTHAAHIACLNMLKAIAQQHPVDRYPIGFRPALACFPDELGIEAELPHLEILGIDLPDQVEIDRKSTRLNSSH